MKNIFFFFLFVLNIHRQLLDIENEICFIVMINHKIRKNIEGCYIYKDGPGANKLYNKKFQI